MVTVVVVGLLAFFIGGLGCGSRAQFPPEQQEPVAPGFAILAPSEVSPNIQISEEPIGRYYTLPSLMALVASGNVVVAAMSREANPPPNSLPQYEGKVFIRRSGDGGRTWEPRVLLHERPGSHTHSVYLATDTCGTIYAVVGYRTWPDVTLTLYRSLDGAKTFESLGEIQPVFEGAEPIDFVIMHVAKHAPCGEFYAVAWGPPGDPNVYILASKDFGATFAGYPHPILFTVPNERGGGEPHIAVAPNGDLYIARTAPDDPVGGGPLYRPQIYLYRSTDSGRTLRFVNKVTDASQYTVDPFSWTCGFHVRISDSGRILVSWLNLPERSWEKRQWMLSVSDDNGETFRDPVKYNDLNYENGFNCGTAIQRGSTVYAVYISQRSEKYQEPAPPYGRFSHLVLRISKDGGLTFSPPARVNTLVRDVQTYLMDSAPILLEVDLTDEGILHMLWSERRYFSRRYSAKDGDEIFYARYPPP